MTVILEGGAVGHLYHLYDNPELTFGEIKSIIKAASAGKLEKVSEKLDGLNLVFTWDESGAGLRVARNGGDIKSGGMDAGALAAKFADRGNLGDAFNQAFKVLNQALGSLPPAVRKKVFGPAGNIWYSMELIYSSNPNVIQYDGNNVVFHGWPVFKSTPDGGVEKGPGEGVDFLVQHLEGMQKAVKEKNWSVRGPALVAIKKMSDKSVPTKAIASIQSAMSNAKVGDSDTIGQYLYNYVLKDAKAKGMPTKAIPDIAARVSNQPGAPNLTQIKQKITKEEVPAVQEYVKMGPKILKGAIGPIEAAIHEFAVEALRGLSSTLISKSGEEVDRLRGELKKAVSAIESSGNDAAMAMLQTQMQKLGHIDNLSTPMEGVVFIHNGNAYKFTGAFAPVNQILGLFKYGRGKTKIAAESRLENVLRGLIQEVLLVEDGYYASEEEPAKARYDNIVKKRKDHEANLLKKSNFIAAMKAAGYDPFKESDRNPEVPKPGSKPSTRKRYEDVQKIKADPRNQFIGSLKDPPEYSKSDDKELAVATKNYRYFDPSITNYSRPGSRRAAVASNEKEEFNKTPILPIEKVVPLKWYKWEYIESLLPRGQKLPDYGSTVDSDDYEDRADVGVGPGEERLEYIFGGNVKGGGVSYDVVTPDHRKWEVKALEEKSSTVRPGTEGKAAVSTAREQLASVMNQMKLFVETALEPEAFKTFSRPQQQIINYVRNFVSTEYEEVVGKGEVTLSRFKELYGVLRLISRFRNEIGKPKKEIPTVVGLNDKKIAVDKPTFLDVANIVKKSTNDDEALKPFESQELVVSTLKDPAFGDYDKFYSDFMKSIDVSEVFRQVDGVFIVNRKNGFVMVPKDEIKNVFTFSKISQATPRFKFNGF